MVISCAVSYPRLIIALSAIGQRKRTPVYFSRATKKNVRLPIKYNVTKRITVNRVPRSTFQLQHRKQMSQCSKHQTSISFSNWAAITTNRIESFAERTFGYTKCLFYRFINTHFFVCSTYFFFFVIHFFITTTQTSNTALSSIFHLLYLLLCIIVHEYNSIKAENDKNTKLKKIFTRTIYIYIYIYLKTHPCYTL